MSQNPRTPTPLSAKLKRLFEQSPMSQREIAEKIGVSVPQVSLYTRGAVPGAAIMLRIARLTKVPFDWLADDAADWPPASVSAAQLNNDELMNELALRYRRAALQVNELMGLAVRLDWAEIGQRTQAASQPGQPCPRELLPYAEALAWLNQLFAFAVDGYAPWTHADRHFGDYPGDAPGEPLRTDLHPMVMGAEFRRITDAYEGAGEGPAQCFGRALFQATIAGRPADPIGKAREALERLPEIAAPAATDKPKRRRK